MGKARSYGLQRAHDGRASDLRDEFVKKYFYFVGFFGFEVGKMQLSRGPEEEDCARACAHSERERERESR